MSNQVQPIFILPEGTNKTSGKNAQRINIEAAKQVADQVRTTLGPKGMDKMLVDSVGDVTITNDGVTILEEMSIEHPSAKMIVEIAKTQENEVGDGTTTAVILAGEFLKNAEELLNHSIHPTVLAKGYRLASEKAQEILQSIAEPITIKDTTLLKHIAITAMTGKGAEHAKDVLSDVIVKAVRSVADEQNHIDLSNIKLEKKVGGSVEETSLIKGIILDKERVHSGMPMRVEAAKIALINSALEIKNTEIDAKIQINDPNQMQDFIDQEERMLKVMVEKIQKSGANVVLCQKGIDDIVQHYLARAGIFAARRVKASDLSKLSKATGARIVTNLDDLSSADLGKAGVVEEEKISGEEMIFVRECKNPKSVTLLIRGGTEHVTSEIERALQDALGDLKAALLSEQIVAGAGAPEVILSRGLMEYADTLSGREQLAVQAFAKSMEIIPMTLAENAGLDPIDVITELKSAHEKKQKWAGIDVMSGKVKDAWKLGVLEPLKIKTQAVSSASEVAIMILRIDDVIAGSGKKEDVGGMPPMPPM